MLGVLDANYIGRLKAFRAFQQVELYRLTFIQCAVSVLLNRRKMDKYIFPRGALDKAVTLRPVEPLYCALLSH